MAAYASDVREAEVVERGVVETTDEKWMEGGEMREEEKGADVKVLTESIRSMSL